MFRKGGYMRTRGRSKEPLALKGGTSLGGTLGSPEGAIRFIFKGVYREM